MPALPRGHCPKCGSDVALRKGGLVREHRPPMRWGGTGRGWVIPEGVCAGAGKKAKQ